MGLAIDRSTFTEEEYAHAAVKVRENLQALEMLLARDGFGVGEPSLGAELEMSVVDDHAQALPLNREILAQCLDPNLTLELDRFNLEYNFTPVMAAGKPFTTMRGELDAALDTLGGIAAQFGGRIVPIGILPTLRLDQVQRDAMTDLPRYQALQAGIQRLRREDFHIRIDGAEPLNVSCDHVAAEGANTSFQLHFRVNPADFADHYNAAQLATPLALALAVGANSPYLLHHDLWDETRIALFKQAVDTRGTDPHDWRRAARVPFGHGWVRDGALELFAEAGALYPVIIPVTSDEDAVAVVEAGGLPELADLRMLQGTIWNWNRPVYDSAAGGHVRIEFRALPSGPTSIDLMANSAFLTGLTAGLAEHVRRLLPAFPFRYAEYNFYRAAQKGLDAELLWPDTDGMSPRTSSVVDLCRSMLPLAAYGLEKIGVDEDEAKAMLGIIESRLDTRMTPARWQRRFVRQSKARTRAEALAELVEAYLQKVAGGLPVSEW